MNNLAHLSFRMFPSCKRLHLYEHTIVITRISTHYTAISTGFFTYNKVCTRQTINCYGKQQKQSTISFHNFKLSTINNNSLAIYIALYNNFGVVSVVALSRPKTPPKHQNLNEVHKKKAASYSPTLHCSTIGAVGLNFSVRNGKRWDTDAIAT